MMTLPDQYVVHTMA